MTTRRRDHTPRQHRLRAAVLAAVLLGVPVACGGDDADSEPAEPADAPDADEPVESDADEPAGGDSESGGGLGTGTGTVSFDGEEYRFEIGREAGQCRNLYDVLVVDLPLVEANGTEVPPDSGRLELQVELDDVEDFEPWADLSIPGGRWFAGDDEVAAITDVETPDLTLTASGTSITGTQAMVPLVQGINSAIDAKIEITCE